MNSKQISELSAYEVIREEQLTDLSSSGTLLRHKKSGAKVALIENDDENKVFYIAFRTPVDDSTGVPHIIEHTVLCGSDEFPVKDPFVELAKGSLNTFLNAMTYPDKTVYPVASCNDKDFQNLMHVYLDAVFHPNIYKYKEIFLQEGWHYELEEKDAPITLNGVVYNEMKGAFSSPEGVLDRVVLNSLFPDTTYANESGGDPEVIPELSYEQYLDFHRRYYHPSNSYIYLYGNMDMAEKLAWIDEHYLSQYENQPVDSEIHRQQPFEAPIEITKDYPIARSESLEDNAYLAYNAVVDTVLNKEYYLAFDVLDYALLGAPGAPLKQALLDAGIGKDIISSYDNSTFQPIFSVVAKNANTEDKDRFVQVIRETLQQQVADGISKKALFAGINSAEFKYREADFGSYPKGLIYGLQCMDSWLYDENEPFMHLEAGETFAFLREQAEGDGRYFEKLVQKWLIDNSHASLVMIRPKKGLTAENDKALEKKLADYKATLSEDELQALVERTAELKAYQAEPSPKEQLEKIPLLTRADMKKEAAHFYNEECTMAGLPVVHHDIATNGIYYVDLLFGLNHLSAEDLPYLGVLKAVLGYMDTTHYSYSELANEINMYTGGISSSLNVFVNAKDENKLDARYEVCVKVLAPQLSKAVDLVCEILSSTDLSDEKRLYEILAQVKSRLEMSMTTAGHAVSAVRAMSYFSSAGYFNDAVGGVELYHLILDLESHFKERVGDLKEKLAKLIRNVFVTEHLIVSETVDAFSRDALEPELKKLKKVLPEKTQEKAALFMQCEKKNEGFKDAAQIQYVSRSGNFKKAGFAYTGALRILKTIMNYDYLWLNIRVQGGAYGCMSGFSRNGDSYLSSYRDPNLRKTNEVFEGIPAYLHDFDVDERDMTKFIIGTVSAMDAPLTPATKGIRSMSAYLSGVTDEDAQQERDEVLQATAADIRALEPLLESVLADDCLCVIGNEDTLTKEKDMFMNLEDLF
ncbi:MAG: insulinase family protein [Lachnospiraceae bacterium]|nr:insulinase family protein [bacterium]MDY5516476.1 insulinase family protein [Lachnospiraceae bacterium]